MMNIKVSITEHLPQEIREKMESGLHEYERSHGIDVNYRPFALLLHNDGGDVVAVLDAFSSYSSIHIRDMWVDKSHRGKGYGRALVRELENRFRGSGLNNINLVTCEFQAPEFYRKLGFHTEFVRLNTENPKLTVTGFIKYLDAPK